MKLEQLTAIVKQATATGNITPLETALVALITDADRYTALREGLTNNAFAEYLLEHHPYVFNEPVNAEAMNVQSDVIVQALEAYKLSL